MREKSFSEENFIKLPAPIAAGQLSLEETLQKRKSVRQFKDEELSLEEVAQLLWSAYGVNAEGRRTVPSAGAVYPLTIYLVARKVATIEAGVYRYWPQNHHLSEIISGAVNPQLAQAALGQDFVARASACLVLTADLEKMREHYGQRGDFYVWLEAGHIAQNVYLQVQSLGLGTVAVGAFDEGLVGNLLGLSSKQKILYLLPVGKLI